MQSVTKEVIAGQLKAFGIKFNEKANKKVLGSLVTHELKTRLKEREVKLNNKETVHDLISLWAENQGKKPPVAKSDRVTIKADDKPKEEPKKEEPKVEASVLKKELAKLLKKHKEDCESFGMQDLVDKQCAGLETSCKAAFPELFKACEAYTDSLKAEEKAKVAAKKKAPGAGTTIFGHQKNAISGKIDDALLSADGPYKLEEIAKLAECTVARVKNHINKDLKVGLRCGGVPVDIKETKDGKFSAVLPKKKAA
jgi:hypothetical protein